MATKMTPSTERISLVRGIEKKLASTFKPVTPNSDFVKRLKCKLASTPALGIEEDHSTGLIFWILGLLGVILGFLLGKRLWKFLFPRGTSD